MADLKQFITGLVIFGLGVVTALWAALAVKSTDMAVLIYCVTVTITMIITDPYIGLVNYIAFLYIRPQEFITAIYGFPIMLFIGGTTFVGLLLYLVSRRRPFVWAPQSTLVVWLVAAMVLSNIANLYIGGAAHALGKFLPTFVMYLLIVNLTTSEKRIGLLLGLLVLLTLFLAGQGIYQHYTGIGLGGQTMYRGERIRGIGIFGDPNDLALALLILVPFVYFSALDTRDALKKGILFLTLLVICWAIFLTTSRGGLLSLAFVAFMLFRRRYGTRLGVILGLIGAAGLFVLGPERMRHLGTSEGGTYGRVEAWAVAYDLLTAKPIFGVGAGRFTEYWIQTSHNSFLLAASEMGAIGAIPWVMLFVVSFRNLAYVAGNAASLGLKRLPLYANSVLYGLIGFAAGSMFLSRTYNELLYILLGLTVAVTAVFTATSGQSYKLMDRKDLKITGIAILVMLVVFKIFLFVIW